MKEAELCALFRIAAEEDGWIVYPEVAGWDMVLVWSGEAPIPIGATAIPAGTQVGVEAKMRANVEVLAQVMDRLRFTARPDAAAILVPKAGSAFVNVAGSIGAGVYTLHHCGPYTLPRSGGWERDRKIVAAPVPSRRYVPQAASKRSPLWLPPVVSQGAAGVPSPSPLTKWRVAALRVCNLLRSRGWVTAADFRAEGVNPQIWKERRWIRPAGKIVPEGATRAVTRYVVGDGSQLPDAGFEAEARALAELDAATP